MILGKARPPMNAEKIISKYRREVADITRQCRESVTKKTNEKLGIPEPIVYSPDLEPEQKRQFAAKCRRKAYRG